MEHAYYDPGQFYWIKTRPFCSQKKVFFDISTGGFLINHLEFKDIDNLNDWALAELKYKLLHQNS
jgi:N-acylneuraminate cytidylyltransferase